jgi:hypothetical protein
MSDPETICFYSSYRLVYGLRRRQGRNLCCRLYSLAPSSPSRSIDRDDAAGTREFRLRRERCLLDAPEEYAEELWSRVTVDCGAVCRSILAFCTDCSNIFSHRWSSAAATVITQRLIIGLLKLIENTFQGTHCKDRLMHGVAVDKGLVRPLLVGFQQVYHEGSFRGRCYNFSVTADANAHLTTSISRFFGQNRLSACGSVRLDPRYSSPF